MADKLNKLRRSIPGALKPSVNPVLSALLQGFADADEEIATQLDNTKAQLFVRTAGGQDLNKLAASRGVARPTSLGLTDTEFQELIPNLSLKAKQIRKTFYDTMDVFWGELFSRANVASSNFENYDVSAGDEFKVKVDNGDTQTIKVLSADIAVGGAATAVEIIAIINKATGVTATVQVDPSTGNNFINVRTNTPGLKGSLEIVTSTMIGAAKVDLEVKKHELWQQTQRSVIYEINPNELTIEIPAVVPALRRTLKGSHHWHTDSTIEAPVAPNNGIWEGSFLFDPTASAGATFTVSSQNATIQEVLTIGNVYTKVTVDDNSSFANTSGKLIFGWGTANEEQPVLYRGIPNSSTVLLDPSHVFQNTHASGTIVNVLVDENPLDPSKTGDDLPIYLTSPSSARAIVQTILESLAAAGVIVNFVILAPSYKYLKDNPYISSDDGASI